MIWLPGSRWLAESSPAPPPHPPPIKLAIIHPLATFKGMSRFRRAPDHIYGERTPSLFIRQDLSRVDNTNAVKPCSLHGPTLAQVNITRKLTPKNVALVVRAELGMRENSPPPPLLAGFKGKAAGRPRPVAFVCLLFSVGGGGSNPKKNIHTQSPLALTPAKPSAFPCKRLFWLLSKPQENKGQVPYTGGGGGKAALFRQVPWLARRRVNPRDESASVGGRHFQLSAGGGQKSIRLSAQKEAQKEARAWARKTGG